MTSDILQDWMSKPVRATLKSSTSVDRWLNTLTCAIIGAEEALPIVSSVSNDRGVPRLIGRVGVQRHREVRDEQRRSGTLVDGARDGARAARNREQGENRHTRQKGFLH